MTSKKQAEGEKVTKNVWCTLKRFTLCLFRHKWKYTEYGGFDLHFFVCKRCGYHGGAKGRAIFRFMPYEQEDGTILTYEKWKNQ